MKDVQQLLTEEFSPVTAKKLLETNPMKIINNEIISEAQPHWFR